METGMRQLNISNRFKSKNTAGTILILIFSFFLYPAFPYAIEERPLNPRIPREAPFTRQSFMGSVCYIDYASPGLDFVIMTQERPGQNHLIDDIQDQPFEYISVHREPESLIADILHEIRSALNDSYEGGINKIVIFGKYSTDLCLTQGKADGYLILTDIWIYDTDGSPYIKKVYSLEGEVIGGVLGCMNSLIKKKTTKYE